MLHTFPELESVAEVLKEDVAALENLDEQQQKFAIVAPLVDACEAVKAELPQLKSALKSRFSNVRRGSSKSLYETFSAAVDVLDTKDAAYLVVRELALFVNNERNDPETAFRLLDWLLNLQSSGLSQDLRSKLVDERSVLHKNWKINEFEANKGNASAMNRIIDEMLESANPQDRRDLENLKTTIRENRNQRIAEGIGGWVVWIVVVLIFGFVSSLF